MPKYFPLPYLCACYYLRNRQPRYPRPKIFLVISDSLSWLGLLTFLYPIFVQIFLSTLGYFNEVLQTSIPKEVSDYCCWKF